MLRKTVPDPYSGDWKNSAAVVKSRVRGTDSSWDEAERIQTPSKLRLCWMISSSARYDGLTVPGHEDICKPERPACNLSAMQLSADVIGAGAAWCGRTLMTRRRAMRPRSSPIASAVQGVMECQPTLHCNSPAVVAPDTAPVTGRHCSLLFICRPRKGERLSWPGWLTYSGWFTHITCHQLQVERRTWKVRQSKTDFLLTIVPCNQSSWIAQYSV